jgi:23S rRNA-/tRNA-specific pseudouridylate synthase
LDKETSGVLLLAADKSTFRYFSRLFETRSVQKKYIAILHGSISPFSMDTEVQPHDQWETDGETGWETWQWPLAKDAGGRKNPCGSGQKQPCETRYRVIDHSVHYTMVEIELRTGRKHQIRRHAGLAGHPVVGDTRYSSPRAVNFLKNHCAFERLGLHACSLALQTPYSREVQPIGASEIPIQMRRLFENDKIT